MTSGQTLAALVVIASTGLTSSVNVADAVADCARPELEDVLGRQATATSCVPVPGALVMGTVVLPPLVVIVATDEFGSQTPPVQEGVVPFVR